MSKKESFHSLITFVMFAALCLVGYLWYSGQLGPRGAALEENLAGGTTSLKTQVQFQDKLTELRMQRYKTDIGVKKLYELKKENLDKIREMGINSPEDFMKSNDQGVKLAAINLKGWVAQIEKAEKNLGYYDDAILNVEAMLEKINSERIGDSLALSDEEYIDLQKIIVDLNERLNVETDILEDKELRDLLDSELKKSEQEKSN